MSFSLLFKFIIIGDSGVGKSCLLLQYINKRYRDRHQVTIGVQYGSKTINVGSNNIKLQIWDTAGQQTFQAITRGYYRNAIGAIVCYDICNRQTFNHVERWLNSAQINGPSNLSFMLVGNKSDKNSQRKISYDEGLHLAKQKNLAFIETSAKTGYNIDQIFNNLTKTILNKIQLNQIVIKDHPGVKIGKEKYISMQQIELKQQEQKQKNKITLNNKKSNFVKKFMCCGGSSS